MFKRELEDKIKAELFPSFVNQVMQIKKNRLKILETEITQFEAKPLKDILEKLQETLRVFSTNLIDGFDSHRTLTTALLFQGSGWEIQINSFRKELEAAQSELLKNCKKRLLDKHLQNTQEMLKERMKIFMNKQV